MATLILEHSDLARSNRLGIVLRDQGHRLDIRKLHRGDAVPSDLDEIDAVISMGGGMAPDDTSPAWYTPELELIRAAHAAQLPVLGICFGSQLVGQALGGEVATLDGGIELGWHDVNLTPLGRDEPLFAGIPWTSKQMHWHSYHVATLPADSRVLASSARTPHQAWMCGLRTLAIQYHPEAFAETLLSWADDEPQSVSAAGTTRDALVADNERYDADHARLATRLFERIALMLMPIDRRYAGAGRG